MLTEIPVGCIVIHVDSAATQRPETRREVRLRTEDEVWLLRGLGGSGGS